MTFGINNSPLRRRAFTLIELILVMAILLVAVSLITPSLSRFFGGRSVDSETRKFLSLMRYGQSRAVSEGIPTMLWVDSAKGAYGLEQEPGYADSDPKAIENKMDPGLKIDVDLKSTRTVAITRSQTGRILAGQSPQSRNKRPAIYFSPDGTVNEGRSVNAVSIQSGNNPPVWIAPAGTSGAKPNNATGR